MNSAIVDLALDLGQFALDSQLENKRTCVRPMPENILGEDDTEGYLALDTSGTLTSTV
jgi:hypothetical protein